MERKLFKVTDKSKRIRFYYTDIRYPESLIAPLIISAYHDANTDDEMDERLERIGIIRMHAIVLDL